MDARCASDSLGQVFNMSPDWQTIQNQKCIYPRTDGECVGDLAFLQSTLSQFRSDILKSERVHYWPQAHFDRKVSFMGCLRRGAGLLRAVDNDPRDSAFCTRADVRNHSAEGFSRWLHQLAFWDV